MKRIIIAYVYYLLIFNLSAQNKETKKQSSFLVSEVIEKLKTQYNYKFSFDSDKIKGISISCKQELEALSIQDFLSILEYQTDFTLNELTKNHFLLVDQPIVEKCGVLLDHITQQPIPYVEVKTNDKVVDVTDLDGKFKINVRDTKAISFSHLTYEEVEVFGANIPNYKCDTITLRNTIDNLNEVVINEYLTTGVNKKEDASINLSLKKLKVLPGLIENDVLQSAQLLPGISSPTEDAASLYIRGGTPDENLVLWDGIKVYNTGHLFNQISTFNPNIIDEVSIFRGGTSVNYGDRISGVIDIKSDSDLFEKLKIGGGVNFTHADVYAKIPLSKSMGLLIAGRRSSTDLYKNILSNNLVDKVFQNTPGEPENQEKIRSRDRTEDFNFYDTNLKWLWKIDDQSQLQISSLFTRNTYENNRDSNDKVENEDFIREQNWGVGLRWSKERDYKYQHIVESYYSNYNFEYGLFSKRPTLNLNFDYQQSNYIRDYGLSYQFKKTITKHHTLNFGYQFNYTKTNARFKEVSEVQSTKEVVDDYEDDLVGEGSNHTYYTEYIYDRNKWYAKAGLRFSWLPQLDNTFLEPRVYGSYKLSNAFRLTTSLELKNQQVLQVETFGDEDPLILALPVGERIWVQSGEIVDEEDGEVLDIPVLKSQQLTFGILFKKGKWNIDVEGYYKNLKDLNFFDDYVIQLGVDSAEEISFGELLLGKEKRFGVDFLAKRKFNNYRVWLGYSWINTKITLPKKVHSTTFANSVDQTHVLNISQTLKVKNFEFALGWNLATGRPYTNFTDTTFEEERLVDDKGINGNRFKTYHRLDASIIYRFDLRKTFNFSGFIGASFRNIYNRRNVIGQNVREEFSSNDEDPLVKLVTLERKSLPFTPDVVIRVNF